MAEFFSRLFQRIGRARRIEGAGTRASLGLLLFFLTPSPASATWNKIAQFTGMGHVSASYFFTSKIGLIGFDGPNIAKPIMRTTDGGLNWTPMTTPTLPANNAVWVSDFYFVDKLEGWCTFFQLSTSTGVSPLWRTTDGGLTWTAVSMPGTTPSSVRQTSHALIVAQNNGPGKGIIYSKDSGATWTELPITNKNGLDFVDDVHGVASAYDGQFLYTTDGGVNWLTSPVNYRHEGWGVYGFKGTSTFISVPEATFGQPLGSKVYSSNNGGFSWNVLTTLPFQSSGAIEGIGDVLYVQNSGGGGTGAPGLYRSTDRGATWVSVGGPSETTDTRFTVTGCGEIVYAFDNSGAIWKTTDGGGPPLLEPCGFVNHDTLKTIAVSMCDTLKKSFYLHNKGTNDAVVLDFRIVDSTRKPFATGALGIDSLPEADQVIPAHDSTLFSVGWRPLRLLDSAGKDSVLIRIIYYTTRWEQTDTVYLPLGLVGLYTAPNFTLSARAIRSDSVSTCSKIDTLIDIINGGCDTLRITRAFLLTHTNWSLADTSRNPLTLPIAILPGRRARLRVTFNVTGPKPAIDSIKLTMRYLRRDTSTTLGLNATGKLTSPVQLLSAIQFDSIPTCVTIDSLVSIVNNGCDILTLTSSTIVGSVNFALLDSNHAPLALPLSIPAGKTVRIRVHFHPTGLGGSNGQVLLHYHYDGFDSTNTISLSGSGKATGALDFATAVDLGTVSFCSQLDTTIEFRNSTCADASIDSLVLATPFSLIDVLPRTVPSGQTVLLHVRFSPGGKGLRTSAAYLHATLNGNAETDTLSISAIAGPGTSTYLRQPQITAIQFNSRTECDDRDSIRFSILNSGCDSLYINAITLDGSVSPALEVHADHPLPYAMPGNHMLYFEVAIQNLVAGTYSGFVHVNFAYADGTVQDSLIEVSETITPSPRLLSLDTLPIDLGQMIACVPHDTTIIVRDTGCGPMVISERSISGNGFMISTSKPDPIVLQPGESDTIHVIYDPTKLTNLSSVVTVKTNADITPIRQITVTANIAPVDSVRFLVTTSLDPIKPDETMTVMVKPDRPVTGKALHTISGVLEFFEDAVEVISVSPAAPLALTSSTGSVAGGKTRVVFRLSGAGDITLDPTVSILNVFVQGMISVHDSTAYVLGSVLLNDQDPCYSPYVLSADHSNGLSVTSHLEKECGTNEIQHLMEDLPLLGTGDIQPNPLTSRTGFRAKLPMHSREDGIATITVSDAVGRVVSTEEIPLTANADYTHNFDLSALAGGSYYFTVTMKSANNISQTRGAIVLLK